MRLVAAANKPPKQLCLTSDKHVGADGCGAIDDGPDVLVETAVVAGVIALSVAEHQLLTVGLSRLTLALFHPHSPQTTGPAGHWPQLLLGVLIGILVLVLEVPITGLDLQGNLRPGPIQSALPPSG